jgi:phage terminase large subunit-like protein
VRPDFDTAYKIITQLCVGTLGEWSGKPVQLLDWQVEVLQAICAVDENGQRVYTDIWVEIPRKAGKTAFCSYLAICAMLMEDNPEVLVAAATRDQASILLKYTTDQIRLNPKLQHLLEAYRKEVRIKGGLGHMQTVPSDGPAVHGKNPSAIFCDEIHAWAPSKAEALYEALDTSRGARNAPMVVITTAGSAYSFAHKLHRKAKQVLDGEVEDRGFKAIIYAAGEKDDPSDPATWYRANPSLGVTIPESWYAQQYRRAANDASRLASFRKLQLNQWEGSSDPFIEPHHWRAWVNESEEFNGWECMLGIDLSSLKDWECYCLIFYKGDRVHIRPYFQIPAESWALYGDHYGPETAQWVEDGWINVIKGAVHTNESRLRMIEALIAKHDIQHIGFDPYAAAEVANVINSRYGEDYAVAIRQGILYVSEPMKTIYRRGMQGKLTHDGNPVSGAHIAACNVFYDKNHNMYYDKSRATDKIDFVSAMVTAMATLIHFEDMSYYASHDIVFI